MVGIKTLLLDKTNNKIKGKRFMRDLEDLEESGIKRSLWISPLSSSVVLFFAPTTSPEQVGCGKTIHVAEDEIEDYLLDPEAIRNVLGANGEAAKEIEEYVKTRRKLEKTVKIFSKTCSKKKISL